MATIPGEDGSSARSGRRSEADASPTALIPPVTSPPSSFHLSLDGIEATLLLGGETTIHLLPSHGKIQPLQHPGRRRGGFRSRYSQEGHPEGIADLIHVPGRLEKVSTAGQPAVFVDYAHTDDALRRVLQNLSLFRTGRIITVFGCGGDRDRGKRPLMGEAASAYSDLAIVTSDNPRTEDPLAIIREIETGIRTPKFTDSRRSVKTSGRSGLSHHPRPEGGHCRGNRPGR